jgi:glyoxylase-like metal-dependent hydrolase (beta-lactamase superfamily II)
VTADILDVADKLWRGEVPIRRFHPVGSSGALAGLAEICDGIAFVPAFANVTAIRTADGLVLVDTGSEFAARTIHDDVRRWDGGRLHTAVYSHGHIDHVFGVPVWAAESAERNWPAPVVLAHEAVPRRFDRYRLTAGYNQVVNQRQFGIRRLRWPTEYRYPDRTYASELTLEVGGIQLELRHERGETDDHTVTWLPAQRALCCGDLFIWAAPNAGNPQKVERYPLEWAQALRRMAALQPEYLLPGHGLPVIGADRVQTALTDTAELLESLVEQTLAVMNEGGRLDDAIHTVTVPKRLADRPYLQPVYDEPEFVVRTVWRRYGGWWDGNPATLKPAPERVLAAELAALAGGPGALAARAVELAEGVLAAGEPGTAGDPGGGLAADPGVAALPGGEEGLRVAGHLAELAWLAAPDDDQVARARHRVFAIRAERATSTMSAGIYRWAAGESLGDPFGQQRGLEAADDDD